MNRNDKQKANSSRENKIKTWLVKAN